MRQLAPELPIILTTGNLGSLNQTELKELRIAEVINKPLDHRTLALCLHRVLQTDPRPNQTTTALATIKNVHP